MSNSNELIDVADLYSEIQTTAASLSADEIKAQLEPLADRLIKAEKLKADATTALKKINEEISEIEAKIRNLWRPFVSAVDKAEIKFDHFTLRLAKELVVSADDSTDSPREQSISWLQENGYGDCLKFDINTNTLKSIAKDEYNTSNVQIPGLKYYYFDKIKVK